MTKWAQKSRKSKNGSLQTRWQEAEAALKIIAPAVCTANPDGAAMYLFSDDFVKCPRCQSVRHVEGLLKGHTPTGGTHLHSILQKVIVAHQKERACSQTHTSALIVQDGALYNAKRVMQLLTAAANSVAPGNERDLLLFMQCGDDAGAS